MEFEDILKIFQVFNEIFELSETNTKLNGTYLDNTKAIRSTSDNQIWTWNVHIFEDFNRNSNSDFAVQNTYIEYLSSKSIKPNCS